MTDTIFVTCWFTLSSQFKRICLLYLLFNLFTRSEVNYLKSFVPKRDKGHLKRIKVFPPTSVLYLVGIEKSIFNFTQNVISAVLFCHVFSIFFQTATNASLTSLQNAINPLNQSQRTIPRTVDSTGKGGA